jgi:hypothetical protein
MPLGPIIFKLHLFHDPNDRHRSQEVLLWLLEALIQADVSWIKSHPQTVKLYESSVVYEFDSRFPDAWKDIPTILQDGQGDCEDLACWRAAEMKVAGIRGVRPLLRWRKNPSGGYTYHVLVRWPDGRVEDPSLALGMRGPIVRKPVFIEPDMARSEV